MIEVDYEESSGKFLLIAGIRDTERISSIPGARAKRKTEPGVAVWRVPGTVEAARQMYNSIPDATWTQAAKQQRNLLIDRRKTRIALMKGDTTRISPFNDDRLSPPQNRGVDWLLGGSGLLADDMGSGKTVMSVVAANVGKFQRLLVITTQSTLDVWAKHFEEWTEIKPFVFHGTKSKQEKAWAAFEEYDGRKVLITTHALAGSHSKRSSFGDVAAEGELGRLNTPFNLCIIDEAHKMGVNPRNKWVRAMWAIGSNSDVRWALTGTPVNDRPDDLWVLMRFVNPDVFSRFRGAFRDRYCIMKPQFHGGMENAGLHPDMEDEFQWVLRPHFLRRLKREVVKGLPDAQPVQYIRLPMTPNQKKAYNQMVKAMMANVEGGLLLSPDGLSRAQSCEYIADGVPVLGDDGTVVALDATPSNSNKLTYILDVAEQRQGDPFVVYAYSSKTVDMLAQGLEDRGYKVGKITGSTPKDSRSAYVKLFQDGKLGVLLITDAGAEGLTLTAADLIIFARESWRAPVNQQVKDRIDRWGQERPPQTIVLLSEDTVDETRRSAVETKVGMQEQVLQDKKKIKAFLTGQFEEGF